MNEERSIVDLLFEDDLEYAENIPLRPIGPSTYILRQKNVDMTTDGWKWKVRGSCKLPAKDPIYRRSLYFYHGQDGIEKNFQRHIYERLDDEGRVVVKYLGEPQCSIPAAHGNSTTSHPYVRTKPSVLTKIKDVVSSTGGHAGPAKIYKEAVRQAATGDQRDCPRDVKQVCNTVQGVRNTGRMSNDGISNLLKHIMEERPIDVVVEGFVHLQQFHALEVIRGLAGTGSYRLRLGFPVTESVPTTSHFVVQPSEIVATLHAPSAEANKPPQESTDAGCQSDTAVATLLSARVQLHDGVWLVDDNVRHHDKFMVKLADGSCSCRLPACVHIMAVRIAAGMKVTTNHRKINLSTLRRKCRSGRKQGRKRGLVGVEVCAPDSARAQRNKISTLSPVQEDAREETCISGPQQIPALNASPLSPVVEQVAEEISPPSRKKHCRRSLFECEQLNVEECHDDEASSNRNVQVADADAVPIIWSPGQSCAITDVESGKSPGSLIETEGRWLTGGEIDAVQTLLQSEWSGHGLMSVSSDFTSPIPRPFIQVLFSPVRKHWLTVYGTSKCVYVYDSIAGSASENTHQTVRQLAGKRGRVVYSRTCTQQTMSGDCGCYALAYATTLVLGGDPASYELVETDVRSHLTSIVRQQKLARFPDRRHCYCDGPAGGRMVQCDGCNTWFHVACLSGAIGKSTWLCRCCKAL